MTRDEHNARVRAKRAANRDEANAKRRAYYKAHAKELSAVNRRWDKANAEQRKAARRKWHENSEDNKKYMRDWFCKNRERMNEYGRKSYHKHKERTKPARVARRATRRGADGVFTAADIDALHKRQSGYCMGCARPFSTILPFTVDHVIPIARDGSNWPDNIQLMCMPCNDSKGTKLMGEWYYHFRKAA